MTNSSFVGAVGTVIRPVRGGRVPGEVQVVLAGEPTMLLAYSDDALASGQRIQITGNRGMRQVDVAPWPRLR